MKALFEIRSGEGGDDAKLFIEDMTRMYTSYFRRKNIAFEPLDKSDSSMTLRVEGELEELLQYEPGVHRVQRVPPTETRGRRHSSTITVAVLPLETGKVRLDPADIKITTFRGPGPGGQHRNTSDTAIRARHLPTGIEVSVSRGRSQHRNKEDALEILRGRVLFQQKLSEQDREQSVRRKQIGKCGRAEKIRTYNFIENRVKDERLKKPLYKLDRVLAGDLDLLYSKIKK